MITGEKPTAGDTLLEALHRISQIDPSALARQTPQPFVEAY
jgi:hypothetical protein